MANNCFSLGLQGVWRNLYSKQGARVCCNCKVASLQIHGRNIFPLYRLSIHESPIQTEAYVTFANTNDFTGDDKIYSDILLLLTKALPLP